MVDGLKKYLKSGELQKLGIRLRVIGQRDRLPKSLQRLIEKAEKITENNFNSHI